MKKLTTRLFSFILLIFPVAVSSQTTDVISVGTTSYTVPCGVTSITVNVWGGGGGGGKGSANGLGAGRGGGGGAAGGFCSRTYAVTPGQVISCVVGAGGASATNGSASSFSGPGFTLVANGGAKGNNAPNGTTPGTGGTNGAGVGDATGGTTNTQGNNGNGGANPAGGTGGANAAAGSGAGGATAGGAGGAPGGGGGGSNGSLLPGNGGAGGSGRITVTWTVAIAYSAADAGANQSLAACATSTSLNAAALTSVPAGFEGTGAWTCIAGCGGVSITTPSSPTSAVTGLTIGTPSTFRWTVTRSGCTAASDDVVITTVAGPMCPVYCGQATQNCASFTEGITNVTFKTINSTSSVCAENGGTAIVTPGSSFPISVTGQGAGSYQGGVWCDWNADGDFSDAGEYTALGAMSPGVAKTGTISVPAGAICDATVKMRVIYTYGTLTAAESCTENDYGEAEDFALIISCCTPNCSNGIQDCNELGIDCGGPCGSPCPGVPSCTNSIQDQDETGVDCGGLICAPCGVPCSTFSGATASPVEVSNGGIVDATGGNQTISTCVNVTYSNRGTNWLHGVFVNPASTGFISTSGVGAVPEPNYSTIGTTYRWRALANNFTGNTSGNSITQDGWYVVTGAADNNPGDNLGWPDGAGTTFGPFCFETVVSCAGLDGDVNAFINFQTTGDSYSGSWTNIDCGKETSFGTTSFSYTLRCPSVLPVEMLDFRARFEGRIVKVSWSTLSEHNTDYFEVYKSNDGTFFEKMETIDAAGNSSFQRDYASYDVNPSNKITYYKIRQYDTDGNKSETKVVGLITPLQAQDISVIPNPVNTVSSVTFTAAQKEMNTVSIVDISGKVLLREEIEVHEGANVYTFNTDELNQGIYFLELGNQTENKKVKFIKSNN
ncbi:MAG: GEVED domain-containing protein [Bacteroidota bacterium]